MLDDKCIGKIVKKSQFPQPENPNLKKITLFFSKQKMHDIKALIWKELLQNEIQNIPIALVEFL